MSHQFQPAWPSSHVRPESTTTNEILEELPEVLTMDELQQGELYILKSKLVVIALFQGWNDEMCCFSILRTDMLDELRWYEARYLPMNFDAFPAFDYAGNPSIFLFPKQLRAIIPINWFNIFEEARYAQRVWKKAASGKLKKPFYCLEHTGAEGSDQELEEIQEEAGEKDDLSRSNSSTKQDSDDATAGEEAEDDDDDEEQEEEEPSIVKDEKVEEEEEQSSNQKEHHENPSSEVVQKTLLNKGQQQQRQKQQKVRVFQNQTLNSSPQPLPSTSPSPTKSKAVVNKTSTKSLQRQVMTPSPHPQRPPVSPIHASKETVKETPAKTFQRQVNRQMEMQTKEVPPPPRGSKSMDTKEPSSPERSATTQLAQPKRPEMNKRRSLSSFFRRKSKKVDKKEIKEHKIEEKRKSAPPSTKAISVKSAIPKQEEPPLLPKQKEDFKLDILQKKDDIIKRKSIDKLEIFDYETFFDMQATFAFLNSNDPFDKFENTLTPIPVANK